MKGYGRRCAECGRSQADRPRDPALQPGACERCGAALEEGSLSAFASRLARFGLGDVRRPLLGRHPELPSAD
jgi:hypothetical protein